MRKIATKNTMRKMSQRWQLRPFDRSLPSQTRNMHRDEMVKRLQRISHNYQSAQGYLSALKQWLEEKGETLGVMAVDRLGYVIKYFWEDANFDSDNRTGGFGWNEEERRGWNLNELLAKKTRLRGGGVKDDMNRLLDRYRGHHRDFNEYDGMGPHAEEEKAYEDIDNAMARIHRVNSHNPESKELIEQELEQVSTQYLRPLRELIHSIRNIDFIQPYDTEFYYRQ